MKLLQSTNIPSGQTHRVDNQHSVSVSVIVSTFNRASDLRRLLESLQNQTSNGKFGWELVVVDNNSSDMTPSVVDAFRASSRFAIVHVHESRQGKSHGLNAGIAAARAPVLAFTDDDAIPDVHWLERIAAGFEACPEASCLGGRVELFNPDDAPITLLREPVALVHQPHEFTPFKLAAIGCNMAIRAKAMEGIGMFDESLGPGTPAGAAEDLDVLYRLAIHDHIIRYDPQILVYHNHGRRSRQQVRQVLMQYRRGQGAFYCKHLLTRDWKRVFKWLYWEIGMLLNPFSGKREGTSALLASSLQLRLLFSGASRYFAGMIRSRRSSIR